MKLFLMMRSFFIVAALFVLFGFAQNGDNPKKIVPVNLKTLDGKVVSSSEFTNDTCPILIVFWLSFHKNPVLELEVISEHYDAWHAETGVKVIAVAVDDIRTASGVRTKTAAREWPFEFYLDQNQEFQRAMNVSLIPHTMIVNRYGVVTWEKAGYTAGDENTIYEQLKLCK